MKIVKQNKGDNKILYEVHVYINQKNLANGWSCV